MILFFASANTVVGENTSDALVKGVIAQAKTDIQRATLLYDAVQAAKDNTKLQIALLEKAVQYGTASRSVKGFEIAEKSIELLAETEPDRKTESKAREVKLYRVWYGFIRDKEEKAELGNKLVASLLESSALYEKENKWLEATKAYRSARSIAISLKIDNAGEIQQKQNRAAYLARTHQNVARYKKSLEKKPESLSVRTALLSALLIDLDDPKEALKYLSGEVDKEWQVYVPLAAKSVEELKPEECRALGDWYYKNILKRTGTSAKTNVLHRAKMYYDLFLKQVSDSNAQTFKARISLGQVENALQRLSVPAAMDTSITSKTAQVQQTPEPQLRTGKTINYTRLIKAIYGADRRFRDVTNVLVKRKDRAGTIGIYDSYNSHFGDPTDGTPKDLIITFELNGKKQTVKLHENTPFTLQLTTATGRAKDNHKGDSGRKGKLVDLLKLIDPKRDRMAGVWHWNKENKNILMGAAESTLQIPYMPPSEYDVIMEFESDSTQIAVVVWKAKHRFWWSFKGWCHELCGLAWVDGKNLNNNPTTVVHPLKNGVKYVTEVRIRDKSVTGFIDGKKIVRYNTNYQNLSDESSYGFKDGFLGLYLHKHFTKIYRLQVREVTGRGRQVRRW